MENVHMLLTVFKIEGVVDPNTRLPLPPLGGSQTQQ